MHLRPKTHSYYLLINEIIATVTRSNVANNQFSGWIPEKLMSIGNLQ
jgi:hypothetical protein